MIIVKDRQGNEHQFPGKRFEGILMTIVDNASEIARPLSMQLVFDVKGDTVSASIKKNLEIEAPGT